MLGLALLAAACGGAIDNGDLFQKEQGSSGSSGSTTTPTATATGNTPTAPPGKPTTPKDDTCAVSFQKDVMAVLVSAGCSALQCHGGPTGLNQPQIDVKSAVLTYKNFVAFEIDGQPYVAVGSKDPEDSAMFCNFRGDCGPRMPIGDKLSSKQLDVMDRWLACGAPFN